MSNVSSNMISKHYCPQCESFDLLKLHRSFIEKRILGSENKLQCRDCGEVIKKDAFKENFPRDVPVFIERQDTQDTIVDPIISAALMSDNSSVDVDTASILTSEDTIDAQNMPLAVEEDLGLPDINTGPDNKAPPESTGDVALVDEIIPVNERRRIWPYVAASLFVFFGAVYAFVWAPMSLSAQEIDVTTVDMTIGEPLQTVSSKAINAIDTKAVPVVVEMAKPEADENVGAEFKLSSAEAEVISVEQKIADEEPVKELADEAVKQLADEEIITELQPRQAIAPQITNPRLVPDSGTKADKALGGLSIASRPVDSEPLVDAPLPSPPVRQSAVIKTDEEVIESVDAEVKITETKAPVDVVTVITEVVVEEQAKVSDEFLELQEESVKAVAVIETQQPAKAIDVAEKKPATQKIAKEKSTATLLESAAAKFMMQDLDKLLSN